MMVHTTAVTALFFFAIQCKMSPTYILYTLYMIDMTRRKKNALRYNNIQISCPQHPCTRLIRFVFPVGNIAVVVKKLIRDLAEYVTVVNGSLSKYHNAIISYVFQFLCCGHRTTFLLQNVTHTPDVTYTVY